MSLGISCGTQSFVFLLMVYIFISLLQYRLWPVINVCFDVIKYITILSLLGPMLFCRVTLSKAFSFKLCEDHRSVIRGDVCSGICYNKVSVLSVNDNDLVVPLSWTIQSRQSPFRTFEQEYL